MYFSKRIKRKRAAQNNYVISQKNIFQTGNINTVTEKTEKSAVFRRLAKNLASRVC